MKQIVGNSFTTYQQQEKAQIFEQAASLLDLTHWHGG